MKIKEICQLIARKEGKKAEVSIGNVREIIAIISDLAHKHPGADGPLVAIIKNGKRRSKRKSKK